MDGARLPRLLPGGGAGLQLLDELGGDLLVVVRRPVLRA